MSAKAFLRWKLCLENIQIIWFRRYMLKWMSDLGWCLGGAYFLAKFQAGDAYSSGAYKKSVYLSHCYQDHQLVLGYSIQFLLKLDPSNVSV